MAQHMNLYQHSEKRLPPIGLRIIKSAVGVLLSFVIYFLRGKQGTPFYSALAVLWCIQPYQKNTWLNALQRTIGTAIGAIYGLIVILLDINVLHTGDTFLHYLLISLVIIPLIYTTVLINKKNASYFSCVVYLSIVVNHLGDANPYLFVFDRACDTMIGILLALVLNLIHIPRKKRTDILFVSGLDEALLDPHNTLTPYSRIELNRMLDDGMNFTIATMRTPASMIEPLKDIHLKLPVIVMDGAALYDTKTHHYEKLFSIGAEKAQEIYSFIKEQGFHVFSNIIIEDLLIILYGDFTNPTEQNIFDTLHTSLYRNYVKGSLPANQDVVYFLIVDTDERVAGLYDLFLQKGWPEEYKILHYPSTDYPGYSYIKIYHKSADRYHMIQYLMEELGLEKLERFGSDSSQCDYLIENNNDNNVVKVLLKHFSPPIWS
ncbi:MAG: HAD hydrolase family protein [Lachnospiraceae bacterium]